MKKPRGEFQSVNKNNCLAIWLGKPNHPESELVFEIERCYLPTLIAILKNEMD